MTKPTSDLLPRNATPFERAVVNSARFDLLNGLVDAARGIKHEIHENVAPWLAAEWFLSDFAPYFDTTAELIASGLPWLRMRGTAAAVKLALSWIGFTAEVEEDEAYLHIDPGSPHAPARLDDIKLLINRSIPAHVLFYRMYHGYDLRHFVLDYSRLDDGLLDDDSGIVIDGIKMSFGTRHAATLDTDGDVDQAVGVLNEHYVTRIWDDDGWRLDAYRLDDLVTIDCAGGLMEQITIVVPDDPDDEPVHLAIGEIHTVTVPLDDLNATVIAAVNEAHVISLPDPRRGWRGPWTGPWREAIAARYLELED